jgi:protein ImuB
VAGWLAAAAPQLSMAVIRAAAGRRPGAGALVRAQAAPLAVPNRADAASPLAAPRLWLAVHLTYASGLEELQRLALCAQQYTPQVSLELPDAVLLEVQGSLHLFAGVDGMRRALGAECRRLGLQSVLTFAPTPLAALALARAGEPRAILDMAQLIGQLAPLPLTTLRWSEAVLERLEHAGVRTLGAALRLPRGGFARRFGTAQLASLDALTGRTPDLRTAFRAPERFRRRCELGCELESGTAIVAALAPLCAALGRFLTARQSGIMQLEYRLTHRHAPATRCVLRLAAPTTDGERLAELLAERLGTLSLPEPVRACELRSGRLLPYAPERRSLWQPGEQGGSLGSEAPGLIERLRARLGPAAVHGLTLLPAHRPECAWAVTGPPAARTSHRAMPEYNAAAAAPRPLWLLPAPRRLSMRSGLPRRRGALRLMTDPERIESGWWDGRAVARDYYVAVDGHGVRLWVFRERAAPHHWFLHGVFG